MLQILRQSYKRLGAYKLARTTRLRKNVTDPGYIQIEIRIAYDVRNRHVDLAWRLSLPGAKLPSMQTVNANSNASQNVALPSSEDLHF
jgi:hypothetical protein